MVLEVLSCGVVLALCGMVLSLCGEVLSLRDKVWWLGFVFHSWRVEVFLWSAVFTFHVVRFFYDRVSSLNYVIINTAHQKKTSTHHDGNKQVTSKSRHIMTKPHHIMTKPCHIMTKPDHIIKPHHTKLQNIKTILHHQRNKDYIKKVWLSIRMLCSSLFCLVIVNCIFSIKCTQHCSKIKINKLSLIATIFLARPALLFQCFSCPLDYMLWGARQC